MAGPDGKRWLGKVSDERVKVNRPGFLAVRPYGLECDQIFQGTHVTYQAKKVNYDKCVPKERGICVY